jgi:uncharacterized phage protein (TIGR01671 family)
MREIKFRAWDEKNQEMVFISLKFLVDFFNADNVGFGGKDGFSAYKWMQFTGLTDKNGKEVYEGDILRQHWPNDRISLARIYFNEDLAGFKARNIVTDDWTKEGLVAHLKEQRDNGYIISLSQDSEVIGNIYENPDLLAPDCKDGNAPHDYQVEDFSPEQAYEKCRNCGHIK